MANVLINEIEKREKAVAEFDAKVIELETMKKQVAILENELATTNKAVLAEEIAELTGYAVKLGFLQSEETAVPSAEEATEASAAQTTEATQEQETTEANQVTIVEDITNFLNI